MCRVGAAVLYGDKCSKYSNGHCPWQPRMGLCTAGCPPESGAGHVGPFRPRARLRPVPALRLNPETSWERSGLWHPLELVLCIVIYKIIALFLPKSLTV